MGIRGVDIQVAIQRAAEADKIQQSDSAQGRGGEASAREANAHQREQTRTVLQEFEKIYNDNGKGKEDAPQKRKKGNPPGVEKIVENPDELDLSDGLDIYIWSH